MTNRKFFELLFFFDRDLAEKTRLGSVCSHCLGKLHQANFKRKPRGGPEGLDEDFNMRFSFCCYTCRKRMTVQSIRFLGPKVYLGAVITLISAMLSGASKKRQQRLQELCGADSRTLARWRKWWAESFAQSSFWKTLSGRFALLECSDLPVPRLLFRAFGESSLSGALRKILYLLLPLTGGGTA